MTKISGQFQDNFKISEISGISRQLGALWRWNGVGGLCFEGDN